MSNIEMMIEILQLLNKMTSLNDVNISNEGSRYEIELKNYSSKVYGMDEFVEKIKQIPCEVSIIF